MTIRNLLDMLYADNEVLNVRIEMMGGISGKCRNYTKEELYEESGCYLDNKVAEFMYEEVSSSWNSSTRKSEYTEKEISHVYILYRNPEKS